jgi:hypothetical protein
MEVPHGYLSRCFSKAVKRKPTTEEAQRLAACDENGGVSLTAYLGSKQILASNYTDSALADYLLTRHIKTRFVDAQTTSAKEGFLDSTDASTRQSMEEYGASLSLPRHASSTLGMCIRNYHMAHLGMEFAQASGANILYMITGNDHVLGERDGPVASSLSWWFREKKGEVLASPAVDASLDERDMRDLSLISEKEYFPAYGLPTVSAYYAAEEYNRRLARLNCHNEEMEYTRKLIRPCLKGVRWGEYGMSNRLKRTREMERVFKTVRQP